MSAQQELLARAVALRAKAATKADALAVRSSITLTRVVFLGLLLLPLFEPHSFYIVRAGHLSSPPEAELHARPDASPLNPSAPGSSVKSDSPPLDKTADAKGPDVAASDEPGQAVPSLPAQPEASTKPIPPAQQTAPPWTDAEVAAAKQECDSLLAKITVVSEALPPAREGICGAPAPRELTSIGESHVKFEPSATLNCKMIAGLNSWVTDTLQPAAQKNFNSPIVRILAGSYSCRNRYGLARAPISEHALMNAIDVSAFVLADGKIIRVSRNWGPTAEELKRAQKSSQAAVAVKATFQVAASKLGAHDVAKKSDDKAKSETKDKIDEKEKPSSTEALKEEQAKQAMSAFLHQAHDGACDVFGTVLGPDTNEAHHDHLHLDMKDRKRHLTLCQ